ncbi:unnamed protein product [Vitrella brassicaformis CCMP3155]|uniref:Cyclin C-terminal domain-containing protein n=1 Tax=Vitrella brassicaformis (strain CCMP3155) TaxID=1169540 RepID=A0A0G4EE23_VITBC|nr:unnamed protein product [Vitrella brassicaformis CCMP3155]|eukprot:CEL93584.1 unnamed protein product [Vitrella brassicaformis CCMP3155]
MKWPQQRAVLVDGMVKRAWRLACRDATLMRAVRLLDVCRADKLIDTNNAEQVANACVAACVERLEPHLLMDDMPDDPTHTQAQVVCRAAADSSVCGIECLEKLFTAAGMDTHGRLFSFAKYLMFLSICDIDLAGCDVPLLAATAVYITRKTNQKQIAGGIWSAALASQSSFSESVLESSMTTLRMQRLMWGDTQTTKGIVTDAVDEMFASPDRHGVASTHKHSQQEQQQQVVWSWCCGRPSADEQHPLAHLFAEDRYRIPDISTTVALRAASRDIRDAFSSDQLRSRLDHSLSRDGDGINTQQLQLVRFDPSLGMGDLLAAVWVAEEGGRWDETGEVLQLASQCGDCTLPLSLTADDINTHWSKTVYMALPRVLAQLMVVGRHVRFENGSRLRLFRRANGEVRGPIEPGFQLVFNPPLAAGHLYQRNRLEHDPPVRSRIYWDKFGGGWVVSHAIDFGADPSEYTEASVSSFAKGKIYDHFYKTHPINRTSIRSNSNSAARVRFLVLTDSSHKFVAWITIEVLGGWSTTAHMGDDNVRVRVDVWTTEEPVCASGAFKDRFPVTTRLARVALARVAPYVFDGQVDDDSDDDDDSDGHGGGWDDLDDDSDGEDSGECLQYRLWLLDARID